MARQKEELLWWDEDEMDIINQTEYDPQVADQLVEDGGLAGWEAALLLGYDESYDEAE